MKLEDLQLSPSDVIKILGFCAVLLTQWFVLKADITAGDKALEARIVKLEQFQDIKVVSDINALTQTVKEQNERLQSIEQTQAAMWNDIRRQRPAIK